MSGIAEEETLQLLQSLVRIPSVCPSIAPDEGEGEQAIAEFAVKWLRERSIEAWLETVAPGRPNVVARIGRSDGPSLVLCGHLDTVHTKGMEIPPYDGRMQDGRVYGRGAYDMKAGVAASMGAFAAVARNGAVRGTLLLALVCDEEYASIGAQGFVEKYRADGCIITEPSDGDLVVGHRGFAWVDVLVKGQAAHGSRWDLGISANVKAGRLLVALDDFDQKVLRSRVHPVLGPSSMHPAIVRGGVGLSTYAPECLIQLEWRTLPGQSKSEIVSEIGAVAREAGEEPMVDCVLFRPPMFCPPEARVRRVLVEAIGHPVKETGRRGWADGALFEAAGIPAINYGVTGFGAHAPIEWVDVESVLECAEVYRRASVMFCGV